MKKVGIIIFIAALVVGVAISNTFSFGRLSGRIFNFSIDSSTEGSGNITAEHRDLSGFNEIEVGGAFHVEVIAGQSYSVEVEADDNLLPLIRTDVDGGVLEISLPSSVNTKNPVRVRISAPDIESVRASGASKVNIAGVQNEKLEVQSSGAAIVNAAGTADLLVVDASGAGQVQAADLAVREAGIDASGASQVSVSVAQVLRAEATGASRITYSGNPDNIVRRTNGVGSVSQK